ncbi:MAG: DUF4465 domain-containing protein [Bacteroidales bacterium]|nr:DUF4465 domain-containing protein [Bacteroidales bacterium]MBP5518254.1 DUF4465 domain-containing protein [Bacteroidales bacterium]
MKKLFFFATVLIGAAIVASCNKSSHNEIPYYQAVAMFDDLSTEMYASDVYGENLYGKGYYWLDQNTGLGSKPVDDQYYSGGIAVGNFSAVELKPEDAADWYKKQLAVNFKNLRSFPGYNNTEHCLVSFGWADPNGWNHAPVMTFTDTDTTTRIIDGLYITNTCYAVAQMTTDLGSGVPIKDGWFKVKLIGLDAAGNEKGRVEVYLANFQDGNKYILDKWQPVALAELGRIHSLKIDMDGSDKGEYGLNTPAYVAIDCIVVRIDKGTEVKPNKANIK